MQQSQGEVLDIMVQSKRGRKAALKFLRKLLKRQGHVPGAIVTDRLRSYGAALRELGLTDRHVTGGRSNNRAEVSNQPTRRRERQQIQFKSPGSEQRFRSSHTAIANHFNVQRHLISRRRLKTLRAEASADWHEIVAAQGCLRKVLLAITIYRDSANAGVLGPMAVNGR
ncbi:hypothetical protein U879_08970 [Defluviimonas sp. 20V17]|nr:hypothetical protein U879_08970 [Defluviimonas sp. 20V17]